MANLRVVKGNCTQFSGTGNKLLIQLCNNRGAYGAGVSGAISNVWPKVEQVYREYFQLHEDKSPGWFLGKNLYVTASEDIYSEIHIVNMIAQDGYRCKENGWKKCDYIDYEALQKCLDKAFELAQIHDYAVHSPLFGCGLAGGDAATILTMLVECVNKYNVHHTIYLL